MRGSALSGRSYSHVSDAQHIHDDVGQLHYHRQIHDGVWDVHAGFHDGEGGQGTNREAPDQEVVWDVADMLGVSIGSLGYDAFQIVVE